jgi:hypothetical protein
MASVKKNIHFGSNEKKLSYVLLGLLLAWTARNTVLLRQRSAELFSQIDLFATIQIAIVFVIAALLILSGRSLCAIKSGRLKPTFWLTIFYLLCLLSSLWSSYPIYTAYRAAEFIVLLTGTCAAFMGINNFRSAEKVFISVGLLVLLMSIYVNIKLVGLSHLRLVGILGLHTNSYSATGAVLMVYAVGEWFNADKERKRWLRVCGISGFMSVLVGTSSASNVSATIGLMTIFLIQGRILAVIITVLLGMILTALIISLNLHWFDLFGWLFPYKPLVKVLNLSGRIGVWEHTLDLFLMNPYIGQGFAVNQFDTGLVVRSLPHSSVFGVMMGTGMLGFSAVTAFVVQTSRECKKYIKIRYKGGIGSSAALLTGFVNSLAMPMVLDQWEESTLVFVSLLVMVAKFSEYGDNDIAVPESQFNYNEKNNVKDIRKRVGLLVT